MSYWSYWHGYYEQIYSEYTTNVCELNFNSLKELWNLLNWIRPGDLGSEGEWNQIITHPLTVGQSHEATNAQLANARQIANRLVHKVLPDMFLRRMKTLIASQLPKKTDKVVFCPLTAFQKEIYERYLETDTVQFIMCAFYPPSLCMYTKTNTDSH